MTENYQNSSLHHQSKNLELEFLRQRKNAEGSQLLSEFYEDDNLPGWE